MTSPAHPVSPPPAAPSVSAVAKGAPVRIYLQHDPENTGEPFSEAHEVTWCVDKINASDIEYVRADRERAYKGKA